MKKDNNKKRDIYRLNKASNRDIAKAMDYINEYTIQSFCGYNKGEADPCIIQSNLYRKNKNLNSVVFEFAMNIMIQQKYIDTIQLEGEPNSVKAFRHTNIGLEKYFNGGFMKELKKSNRQRLLMITGQISIILAGLYYLKEIIGSF